MRHSILAVTFLPLLTVAAAPQARAALTFHLPLDNATLGDGTGGATTQDSPFEVRDIAGGISGTAAGWDTAFTTASATTVDHINGDNPGQIGGSLHFPAGVAANRSVIFGDVLDPGTGSFTLSMWFNVSSLTGLQMFASKGNASSGNIGWSIFSEDHATNVDKLYVRVGQSATNRASQGIEFTHIALNTWHHLAMVVDNTLGTVTGYLNGSNANWTGGGGGPTSQFFTPFDMNATNPLTLGIRNDGMAEYRGGMDDVAAWDEALTAQDISQIYQNGLVGIAVPEPGTAASLIGGLALLLGVRRRRA